MELKDFLGTDLKYDVKTIANDENLAREIQAILIDLNMLNPPVDGIFGPLTTAALHRFQVEQKSSEAGYLGEKTIKQLLDAKEANIPAVQAAQVVPEAGDAQPVSRDSGRLQVCTFEMKPLVDAICNQHLGYIYLTKIFFV